MCVLGCQSYRCLLLAADHNSATGQRVSLCRPFDPDSDNGVPVERAEHRVFVNRREAGIAHYQVYIGCSANEGERKVCDESPLSPTELYDRLRRSWSVETGGNRLASNPACGQCSVTALVIQDALGGDILKTDVDGAWHFYNRIGGRRWDFTMSKFERPIGYDDLPSNRDEALHDTSWKKYQLLRHRILAR